MGGYGGAVEVSWVAMEKHKKRLSNEMMIFVVQGCHGHSLRILNGSRANIRMVYIRGGK